MSLWRAGNPHRQTWAIETKHGEHLAQQSAWMAVFGSHSRTPSTQCGIACGGCKSLGLLSRIFASHLSEVRRTFQAQHVGGACEPHEHGWRTVCLLQPWLRTGRCRAPLHHSGQAAAQRRRGIPQAVVAEGTDNVLLSQTACLRQRRGSLTRTNSIPTLVRDLAKPFPWRSVVCPLGCPMALPIEHFGSPSVCGAESAAADVQPRCYHSHFHCRSHYPGHWLWCLRPRHRSHPPSLYRCHRHYQRRLERASCLNAGLCTTCTGTVWLCRPRGMHIRTRSSCPPDSPGHNA